MQPYLTRAANTFGQKMTGRYGTAQGLQERATRPDKFLTKKEMEAFSPRPKAEPAPKPRADASEFLDGSDFTGDTFESRTRLRSSDEMLEMRRRKNASRTA